MKALRIGVILFGLCDLVLTLGYYFRQDWATSTWPWTVSPLDYLLVSSFLAGATVVILWLGLVGDWGAADDQFANFFVELHHLVKSETALVTLAAAVVAASS